MGSYSELLSTKNTEKSRDITLKSVLNTYGACLFLGLLLSIFTHGIEDRTGFLLFILISSIVYFILLNLYFISEIGRKVVFITLCLIGLFSLCMVFYFQLNPAAH